LKSENKFVGNLNFNPVSISRDWKGTEQAGTTPFTVVIIEKITHSSSAIFLYELEIYNLVSLE
jgi:hypothetical protein